MSIVDSNHDDQISYDELLAFAKSEAGALFTVQQPSSLMSKNYKANLIFDSYDENNDETLS